MIRHVMRLLSSPTRVLLACAVLLGATACDKPSPDNCRKALVNMKRLLGTEKLGTAAELEGDVRRCTAGSTRKAVACALKAKTMEELERCDFYKQETKRAGSAGSASGSAGSAGGSAAGSAGRAGSSAPAGSAGSGG